MAAAFIIARSAGSTGALTTVATTVNADLAIGTFVVICAASDAPSGVLSAADNSIQAGAANTYTRDRSQMISSSGQVVRLECFSSKLTRSVLNTDTLTVTWTVASGRRSMNMLAFSGISGSTFERTATSGGTLLTTNQMPVGPVPITSQADELIVGFYAVYTGVGASGYADGTPGYVAVPGTNSGGGTTDIEACCSYKIATAIEAATDNPRTNIVSPLWQGAVFTYLATASTALTGGGGLPGGYQK